MLGTYSTSAANVSSTVQRKVRTISGIHSCTTSQITRIKLFTASPRIGIPSAIISANRIRPSAKPSNVVIIDSTISLPLSITNAKNWTNAAPVAASAIPTTAIPAPSKPKPTPRAPMPMATSATMPAIAAIMPKKGGHTVPNAVTAAPKPIITPTNKTIAVILLNTVSQLTCSNKSIELASTVIAKAISIIAPEPLTISPPNFESANDKPISTPVAAPNPIILLASPSQSIVESILSEAAKMVSASAIVINFPADCIAALAPSIWVRSTVIPIKTERQALIAIKLLTSCSQLIEPKDFNAAAIIPSAIATWIKSPAPSRGPLSDKENADVVDSISANAISIPVAAVSPVKAVIS